MNKTILQTLAEYAAALQYEQLPAKVIAKANDCLFDLVGCYYAALARPENRARLQKIMAFNPSREAAVWGTGEKCGVGEAALAIGTLAYDLEYDDGIPLAGHWGSSAIPAALLAVAQRGGTGKDLLAAIAAAYEVGTRISRIYSPRLLKKHVHFPCVMGAFAAAAGYARGSGAAAEDLAGALSLAGLYPVGTYSTAISGGAGKGLYSGWPNYLGVNAVRLAAIGLAGDADVLENPYGFGNVFGFGPAGEEERAAALHKLGEDYRMMEVYFKPYPCCRWLHAPVHAALKTVRENSLGRADIDRVRVYGSEFIEMYNTHAGFESKVTCQYSIPYSVGAAVYFGCLGLSEYEEAARGDAGLHAFISKVEVHTEAETRPGLPSSRVSIVTKDGRTFDADAPAPWSGENPPEAQELIDKFTDITAPILSPQRQAAWVDIYKTGIDTPGMFEKALALLGEKV